MTNDLYIFFVSVLLSHALVVLGFSWFFPGYFLVFLGFNGIIRTLERFCGLPYRGICWSLLNFLNAFDGLTD